SLFSMSVSVSPRDLYSFPTRRSSDLVGTNQLVVSGGNVGVGTASPSAKLEVAGAIKIGNTASSCNSSTEGQQRYNPTTKKMEYCNGTSWTEFGSGGGGITSCPVGMTRVGDPGKTTTFCIDTNRRTATDWQTAQTTCININDSTHGRAHLCTYHEWRTACQVSGLNML